MKEAAFQLIKGNKVAVIGAGICGSLTAFFAQKSGLNVHVFEPDRDKKNCSFTAAGMLAPMAELESSDDNIYQLGLKSLQMWPDIIEMLGGGIFHRDNGTLVISHRQDAPVFNQFVSVLKRKLGDEFSNNCQVLKDQALEPELKDLGTSLYLKKEAQVDSHQALNALHESLQNGTENKATWHWKKAAEIKANCVDGEFFDWVFDCRGLAASQDIPGMHGVRGEVIMLQAPQVNISRMVRVMHPRYRIYIVPREDNRYMIGATEINSDDNGPMSVRSTLELLSAAFSVHSGFAEARVISLDSNVRPSTLDHQPVIDTQSGITRINGLYRHGYLLSPAVVAKAFSAVGIDINSNFNQVEYADCI
ncbi:MAG: FAD-dependent oxidoreductase [Bermanella sp.]